MNLPEPLTVEKLKELIRQDVIIFDTRNAASFMEGFIPGSVFFGLDGRITEWVGDLITPSSKIALITDPGKESESISLLQKLGIHQITGFLQGGMEAWLQAGEPGDMIIEVEPDELLMDIPHDKNLLVIDVRRNAEFSEGHLPDALNLPLNEMGDVVSFAGLEEDQNLYIICSNGYRSVIAASILKKHGMHNLRNVAGGWERTKQEKGVKIEKDNNSLN
jgi:rhodanese-related sulfurtransferase